MFACLKQTSTSKIQESAAKKALHSRAVPQKKKKKKKIDSWEKNIPDVKKDNELVGFLHGLKILVQE